MQCELEVWKIMNRDKIKDLQTELLDKEKEILQKQLEDKLITQQDYNLAVLQLEADLQDQITQQKIDSEQKERERKIEKAQAKLELAFGFADNLAKIFGENTAVGKAAAVASTTIDTYKSATASYSSLAGIPIVGPALGFAAAAAAIAAGLANVKNILSIKSGLPGEKSVGASMPSASAGPATQVIRTTVNPEIGQGIISREVGTMQTDKKIIYPPVLIIDDVTSRQNRKLSQIKTATL